MTYAATKERAYELIDRMPPEKMPEIVEALERLFCPVRQSLLEASFEDEEVGDDEKRVAAEARARGYLASTESHEEFLNEFGLTLEDWERMGSEPVAAKESPTALH